MARAVTGKVLDGLIREYGSALRASFPNGELPAAWAGRLESIPRTTALGKLKYWKWLAIYSELRAREKAREGRESDADARDAVRSLLRREPVVVQLGPHRVEVTSRSYAAMAEIASHALRITELEQDARRLGEIEDELAAGAARRGRGFRRRRLRRIARLHRIVLAEIALHRRAIFAHALTPDGAPARGLDEAPAWFDDVDAAWDGALLAAVHAAGAGRYARLGEPPGRPSKSDAARPEDFGWASLFATVEREMHIPAAELYDRDLWQLLTWLRAGAPPELPEAA